VFENRVLRRVFGPNRVEMVGGWKVFCVEELHNMYASPSIIRVIKSRRMRWGGHITCTREMRNTYNILVGKPERKRPFKRPRHRLEDNIIMDLREIRWGGLDFIHLAQDRDLWWAVMNIVMNLQVP
jgi:hypothetical protein